MASPTPLPCWSEIDCLGASDLDAGQPLRDAVDADDPQAPVQRDAARHVTDGPEPEHDQRAAVGHVGVLHGLPRGGEHVGQVHEALVGRTVRNLDVCELRLGHTQQLGLSTRHLPVQLRVAEQRRTHALVAHLCGLALGVEQPVAHVAVAAGDLEGHDHPVAHREIAGLAAHLLHDAHGLVSEDVSLLHERAERLVQVQVGAADVGGGDPDYRVRGLLDHRIRNRVDANVLRAVPGHCPHRVLLCR